MKKLLSFTVFTYFFVSIASSGAWAAQQEPDNGQLVSTELAKTEQVNPTMWLPGNVVSRLNAPISAEQTGQLLWIEEVGTQVEQGQSIAKIDNRHLLLQLARQQAEMQKHQANVDYLTKQKKRMSTLSQKNNTAVSELERITKDLAVAESDVMALKMSVKQIKLAIEHTHITAPFSGNISQRFANIGELIAVGRPLVQLVNTEQLDIRIAAPLSIAPYLTLGAPVTVKWQDKLIELPVRTWSKAGDQSSRTFDVRLAANELNLLAGSAVTVSLPKQIAKEATLVPRDALVLRENETFVLTVDDEDKAQKVNVLVGQGIGSWIAVSGALDAGDEVIIRGGERLQQGQKIRRNDTLIAQTNAL
ncbi:efflux RND transporter periplasmic adaptor subunit [Colwelliaceae bacterium 6471]